MNLKLHKIPCVNGAAAKALLAQIPGSWEGGWADCKTIRYFVYYTTIEG